MNVWMLAVSRIQWREGVRRSVLRARIVMMKWGYHYLGRLGIVYSDEVYSQENARKFGAQGYCSQVKTKLLWTGTPGSQYSRYLGKWIHGL